MPWPTLSPRTTTTSKPRASWKSTEEEDARHQVLSIARQILLERIRQSTSEDALAGLVHRVASRELDPHSAAEGAAGVLH